MMGILRGPVLEPRLSDLRRATDTIARGFAALETEGSSGSSGLSAPAGSGANGQISAPEPVGINTALLQQQRTKERERKKQVLAEAAVAASHARQQANDWQEQHDRLMTQHLATRQRLEELEAVHERLMREGCSGCQRLKKQVQQASDEAANTAAQLRDVRAQLQEARSSEEATRRQLAQITATANDQAAAGDHLRKSLERTLQLAEQTDMARKQREDVQKAQEQVAAERRKFAMEQADTVERTSKELNFQRHRAEALQEHLEREREETTRLKLQLQQSQDERNRAVRQLNAAELSLEARQQQLEAAKQQQDTLVDRMFEAQEAREDAEHMRSQFRSLTQQLEVARTAAARSVALEGKLSLEREAKEELAARVSELESQLATRDETMEAMKRQLREQEAALNSAIASRQAVIEQASKSGEEARTLTQENARMFHHLEKLQEERKKAESQARFMVERPMGHFHVALLSSQLLAVQEEATTVRVELAAAREQLAAMQNSQPLQDATLAQHQLSGQVLKAQAEAAAMRTLAETLNEYADELKRNMRRHGLSVPEMPGSADVVSQIGTLQSKLAAEAEAAAEARTDATQLRKQLEEARAEIEKLRLENQKLAERTRQLEEALSSNQAGWQHAVARDEKMIADLTVERDSLQQELRMLKVAGTNEGNELQRKVMRLEVQVDALTKSKRQECERVQTLTNDLATLQKALGEKESEVDLLKIMCDDAKAATERAQSAHKVSLEEAAAAAEAQRAAAAEVEKQTREVERLQSEVTRLETELAERNSEYAGLYDYCAQVLGERDGLQEERGRLAAVVEETEAALSALQNEAEQLRADLADKEQRLVVKPKMAELQYRINELSGQLEDVREQREKALRELAETQQKLQDETEAHYETDGRRVRLGEEVERLRGILRMYSLPF
ncbi:hypothetical protein GPECTOR_29g53 [Gonium pectorale]|uniref:Uncharacterized protein n=1 Tax=Gonium pectorale TaxID=33097 RepID=A0A150GEM2_GONPE|nr:hypothetical protein GPECTOR_29g53 [Gonium pectorale]|eukprot:KXZ48276.1 hypothetical protein GPECTOR_29g53 [Gonium pectorale]